MNEPTDGLASYQSIKKVLAGEITEVVAFGCYVKNADGTSTLREFLPNMTARYTPVAGDFWIIYPDGFQSLSPAQAFKDGYRYDGYRPSEQPTRVRDAFHDCYRP